MRTAIKTCKVKLDIPEERKQDVLETFRQYNYALNFCIEEAWKPQRKIANKSRLHKLTYYPLRERTSLPANLICSARNKACEVVKGVIIRWHKGRKASKPRFKPFSAIQLDKRTLTIKSRYCTFSTVNGRVRAKYLIGNYQREILDDSNYEKRTGRLVFRNGSFFLDITVTKAVNIRSSGIVMGVDLGIKNIAVTSTGKFFSASFLNDVRRQLSERRASIQKKGTRSAHKLLRRLGGLENRISNWILHNVSRQIVNEAIEKKVDVIAFECLTGIRKRAKSWKRQGRGTIHLWAFSRLQRFVQYKALEAGIDVVFVDSAFTSQRCSKCGHTSPSNRRGSSFACKHCGYSLNADLNASKNIAFRAISGESPDVAGRPSKLALKSGAFSPTDKLIAFSCQQFT